jgi:DNA-binding MarR family transcriptional regulator
MQDDESAKRIAGGLARLGLALRAQSWRTAQSLGLTPTQSEILQHLAENATGLGLADLAARLKVSAPTASEAVATLHNKELVRKTPGKDKRAVLLTLTKAGQKAAANSSDGSQFLADPIADLPAHEQAALLSALSKIIRNLQEQGFIAPQRLCVTCQHFRPHANSDAANPHHCALIGQSFGAMGLRLNCGEHVAAPAETAERHWLALTQNI